MRAKATTRVHARSTCTTSSMDYLAVLLDSGVQSTVLALGWPPRIRAAVRACGSSASLAAYSRRGAPVLTTTTAGRGRRVTSARTILPRWTTAFVFGQYIVVTRGSSVATGRPDLLVRLPRLPVLPAARRPVKNSKMYTLPPQPLSPTGPVATAPRRPTFYSQRREPGDPYPFFTLRFPYLDFGAYALQHKF